jgi:hypothetical protein
MYLGLDFGTSSVKGVLIDAKAEDHRDGVCPAQGVAAAIGLVGAESGRLVEGLQHRGQDARQ